MARRPAAEQGDTRRLIRDAAFRLFGQFGYDGVSMLDVSRAAGVTKAALYWHFVSKDDLYLDSLEQLFQRYRTLVFERMEAAVDPLFRILALFEGMGRLVHDPAIRGGVAGYWLAPGTADVHAAAVALDRFERETGAHIEQTLQRGIEAGLFQFDRSIEDMALAVTAIMEAIVVPLRDQGIETTRRLIHALAHTFFRAHAPAADSAVIESLVAAMVFQPS